MRTNLKAFLKRTPILKKYLTILKNGQDLRKMRLKKSVKGKANIITIADSVILYNCSIDIKGDYNQIEIEELSRFNNVRFYIRGDNNKIKIAENVRFTRGGSIWIEDINCELNIGEYSSFEDVHLAVTEPGSIIDIGRDCMFAYDIDVRTGDSHSVVDTKTNKRINYAQNVQIGDHVWIGSHVSILKGIKIPDNSVVATRALVTKPFSEENILIGGIPAKKIKDNITWLRARIYD